jgi:sarcosine oxidase
VAPDVAIIGGGIVGLAAADALARRGAAVLVYERGEPGAGQSAGRSRGFRHLHATPEKIARAARARAGWDAWSERAGVPLVGDEGALRLGGDVDGDVERLRAAGVAAEVVDAAGARQPALRADAGPLLWDPRGGAIRARTAIEWLCRELGDRVRAGTTVARAADVAAGHVLICAGAGTERLWPRAPLRRVVHLRVTFEQPAGGPGATWADRSDRFGARTYGVADAPGRFAIGLAELDLQPVPADPAADAVPEGTGLGAVRERLHAYARSAFPGLGAPVEEVVRLLTVLPGDDEDEYLIERGDAVTALVGHNLFKLAPVLGEQLADAVPT